MFKLGIHRLDGYHPGPAPGWRSGLRSALSRNRVAFSLLRCSVPATPKQLELFERVLPLVRLSSGVYRTTFRGRFKELNGFLNERLTDRFDSAAPLLVEDWAASDCLTSSEWAASLFPLFPGATITASDLTLFLIEAGLGDGSSYIVEAGGEPLQYIRPPFVVRMNPPEPRFLAVNAFLERRARAALGRLRNTWRIPGEWLESETPEVFEQPPFTFRKIPLIHPEAQALRAASDRFRIRRHSVFEPTRDPCDVIRTMNIFNRAYFSAERLLEGARAVAQSLREGGVWIVGRTVREDPPQHGVSVFVRESPGFRLLDCFGAGSEIQDLVLDRFSL